MKQRKLEIILEQAKVFDFPSAELEQYYTPATVAARLLHFAFLRGDIASKRVVDLGCGTGVLALGAALLGGVVTGVDSDDRALEIAQDNAKALDVDVTWLKSDIGSFDGSYDTVISDRPFLRKAVSVGQVIYLLHNAVVNGFVRHFVEPHRVTDAISVKLPIAHTFKFHKDEVRYVDAIIYRIEVAH
jgi:putative methylase